MDKIIVLDFGSQVTQLIGRRLRELNVYCEIYPYNKMPELDASIKGVILSGSPCSVRDANAPQVEIPGTSPRMTDGGSPRMTDGGSPRMTDGGSPRMTDGGSPGMTGLPILGICYGAQYLAYTRGGVVEASDSREYGRATLTVVKDSPLFQGVSKTSQVWMSHGDTISKLPEGAEALASTEDVENAAYRFIGQDIYAVQFHPEVYHTAEGSKILENFAKGICGCKGDWTPASFIESTVAELKATLGEDKVILGLSGGVDSTVTAMLLHKAIGHNLTCIFVNHGLLRKNEFQSVLDSYKDMGLNVLGVDASDAFLDALKGITEPEAKRKTIGRLFVETFDKYAHTVKGARWLGQGTIYPDVIESAGIPGIASKIKSHHNVGGLPEGMDLKVVEPLRMLFKDEVRRVGKALGIKEELIGRHPFPGPGLGIRVLGEVTREKLDILREADDIFIRALREADLYNRIWQAGAILLPVRSVGVMGDERTYEYCIALRAVISTDAMTADWYPLPYDFLSDVSNRIIRKVRGVNRVVYDISSKPPATIEWE